jgi:regulatory protein
MERTGSLKPGNKRIDFKTALLKAASLCSRQEQCTSRIRRKLKEWNVEEVDAENIIRKLQKEKYIDEQRFATFFANDKFRFNGWGKVRIAFLLRQEEIGDQVIRDALDQIDDESYFQACLDILSGKSASLKESNQLARKAKLFRFAVGRGFESDLIHRALNQLGCG